MHRGRGEEETMPTTWDRQGTGPSVEAGRGGSGREDDGGRQREEGTLGQENPQGLTARMPLLASPQDGADINKLTRNVRR